MVPAEHVTYTVTFDSAGGSDVAAQIVTEGEKATEPEAPVRRGSTLEKWQLDGGDYDFDTPVQGDITLTAVWTPNALKIDSEIADRTYNGAKQEPGVTVVDNATGDTLTEGTDYNVVYENNQNAGTAKATVTGMGDYEKADPVVLSFNITQAPVTVIGVFVLDKIYDGSTEATVVGTRGLREVFFGDYVSAVEGTARFDSPAAGTDKTVTFEGFSLEGEAAGNYTLSAQPASEKGNILPKEVGLTWSNTEFTYDGEAHVPTATATGVLSGETVNVSVEGSQTEVGDYTATATSLTGADAGNYTLPEDATQGFTIKEAGSEMTEPTAASGLTYTGQPQELVTGGSATGGTIQYSADGENWSEAVPTGTDAGDYTVYYRVKGDGNHADTEARSLTVTIAKSALTVTAKGKTITYGVEPAGDGVEFDGFVNGETEDDLSGELTYSFILLSV